MSFSNILVPYDESEAAINALKEAVDLVKDNPEAEIHVMKVAAPPQNLVYASTTEQGFGLSISSLANAEEFAAKVEAITDADDKALAQNVKEILGDYVGHITIEVVYGVYTVDTILDQAEVNESDLICMGSRGLGAIRGMIGSVSYGVLRNADIPVLIVK